MMVHNRYQQRGGEDVVFEAECDLLERRGHTVHRMIFDNASITQSRSIMSSLSLAASTVWSRSSASQIRDEVRRLQPDVVHFHNTFPLVSPSAYYAVREHNVRVVQTLHNYRLACPGYELYRQGSPCEDCVGRRVPWPGVRHKCYRGSRGQTAVVATMLSTHRLLGTWANAVDRYIALTEFARKRYIQTGVPESKLVVKPNFLDRAPEPKIRLGDYFLFVGRLTESKGVPTMLSAWRDYEIPVCLRIAGSGPLASRVETEADLNPALMYRGALDPPSVVEEMRMARALVFPSEWYEGFPMTLVESFACGLPVIASRHGAMAEVIDDGRTGILFNPGDPEDLARKVRWAWEHPEALCRMGVAARAEFEAKYTGEQNYEQLRRIYGWS